MKKIRKGNTTFREVIFISFRHSSDEYEARALGLRTLTWGGKSSAQAVFVRKDELCG